MIPRLWFALACAAAVLLLAAGPSDRAALAQAAAQNPTGAGAPIRADHQVEDLRRLLDLARERGQDIVVRLEPASAGAESAAGPRLETSLFAWWHAAAGSFLTGLDRGIQGVLTLPQLADNLARAWRGLRNAASAADRRGPAAHGPVADQLCRATRHGEPRRARGRRGSRHLCDRG